MLTKPGTKPIRIRGGLVQLGESIEIGEREREREREHGEGRVRLIMGREIMKRAEREKNYKRNSTPSQ